MYNSGKYVVTLTPVQVRYFSAQFHNNGRADRNKQCRLHNDAERVNRGRAEDPCWLFTLPCEGDPRVSVRLGHKPGAVRPLSQTSLWPQRKSPGPWFPQSSAKNPVTQARVCFLRWLHRVAQNAAQLLLIRLLESTRGSASGHCWLLDTADEVWKKNRPFWVEPVLPH